MWTAPQGQRCLTTRGSVPPSWGDMASPPFALLTGESREGVGPGVSFHRLSEAGPGGGGGGHGFG